MTEDDALAAEYALGLTEDRALAERRIADDPAFAALVAGWEARLAELDADFAEVAPPPLLPAIEARLFGRKQRRWAWPTFGGLVAASLAAFLLFAPAGDMVTMRLVAEGQPLVIEAAYSPSDRMLRMERMAGPAAPEGRSYEGWVILPGAAPVSLGVLDGPMEVPMPDMPDGTVIAVSVEPAGGSPAVGPTGPVIVSAAMEI